MSDTMTEKKLWGGRFAAGTDDAVEAFTASVDFDRRLYRQDIAGSIAHARMLARVGVLSEDDARLIEEGLEAIRDEIESGQFSWDPALEDVHMNIEARLTEKVGDAGKRLHTARSRNDQVATDLRLFLREGLAELDTALRAFCEVLIGKAEAEAATVMPGFTHMQSAQPVTLGHHLLAWCEMLLRDRQRLADCRRRLNQLPLGAAALAGTGFPVDREFVARELDFDGPCENSLDAVSDRDFAIEFAAAAALLMVHLSRMAEEIILWSSQQFRFVQLGDAFCTGSSIMPQKKNPDVAELVRGKAARVTGNLNTLLMLMKGQPLAYNRDNQEDKEPLFDSLDTTLACARIMAALVADLRPDRARLREAATQGFSTATDLADYLVRKDVPFRDAHEIVGRLVRHCEDNGLRLEDLPLEALREFSPHIDADAHALLSVEGSVAARDHIGGTAPDQVRAAAVRARKRLAY
ncbi:MAG: argininosuccinate lyase [Gammaproteobacteria bacterium]|jgi:argininosuccinate lyase|nr:argininosuccinate lyase [Gammaproteobacteria bacterium]